MNIHYIDTHCHLDLYQKPEEIARKIEIEGIYTIAVTNAPSVFHFTKKMAEGKKYIRAAIGFHPELVSSRASELSIFWPELENTRYVGEIGLDYSNSDCNKVQQRRVFETILDKCSQYGNKILTIHSRRSAEDVVSIIGNNFPGKIILHWFSDKIKTLEQAIDKGYYFSINHNMLSKVNRSTNLIRHIPANRILTETDGPFIHIENHHAVPSDMPDMVKKLSELINIDYQELSKFIFSNFKQMLEE